MRRTGGITRNALGLAVAAVAAGWAFDAYRRDRRLRLTHRILVDLLLNALTADDATTARHSRRVADLSYALGCAARLPRDQLTTVRVAALMHDLGKIDERFEFALRSDAPLSPEERDQMEEHPDQSARILTPLEELHPGIRAMVASHHERWDGEGYPERLSGERIPLGARIIAIADAFDAMTQPRQYRDPMPVARAFQAIREDAGCQFDPALVDVLELSGVRAGWERIALEGLIEERREQDRLSEPRPASTARADAG